MAVPVVRGNRDDEAMRPMEEARQAVNALKKGYTLRSSRYRLRAQDAINKGYHVYSGTIPIFEAGSWYAITDWVRKQQ